MDYLALDMKPVLTVRSYWAKVNFNTRYQVKTGGVFQKDGTIEKPQRLL